MMQVQTPALPQTSLPQTRADAIATLLGQTSMSEVDWRALMKQGVLVRLTIGRCRFMAKLEYADLGVTIKDERARQALGRYLVLGEKRLLPQNYMLELERIEGGARRLLKKYSFATELGAFLPVTAYAPWKQEIEGYETRYWKLRDEIIANHQELSDAVLAEYEAIAQDTYRRIKESSPLALEESLEEFVTNYCTQIKALIPTRERIRATFTFTYTMSDGARQLPETGADSTEEEVLPIQIRSQNGMRAFEQAAMERDLVLQARSQKREMVDSFLEAIVAQLRSLIYEVTTDVLATLQNRTDGKFSPRSVMQLKNVVKQVSLLNFYGDEDIERIVSQMQGILDLSPERRQSSIGDIAEKLRSIATYSRATLLSLEKEPKSARSLAIPDVPPPSSIRQARRTLGLDLEPPEFRARVETRAPRLYSSDLFTSEDRGERRVQRQV